MEVVEARCACAGELDCYWSDNTDYTAAVDARNEAAALSKLLAATSDCTQEEAAAHQQELFRLCDSYCERVGAPSTVVSSTSTTSSNLAHTRHSFAADSKELALKKAYGSRGLQTVTLPAEFEGGLRGLAAERDLAPGECAVSVPSTLLISYQTAKDSDLGKVLQRLPGLNDEMIAVIWTMVERFDEDSEHVAFWSAVPTAFHTGLSIDKGQLRQLVGTTFFKDAQEARTHLREQHAAAAPIIQALVHAYPTYLKAELFTLEHFLWAAELWYAYAMQVRHADGEVKTCLVPYLSLMNHSPWPHIVHFSRVDEGSNCLRATTFRSCRAGEQIFLSYGPLPNSKLLLFYGFAVPDNPFDVTPIRLEVPQDQQELREHVMAAANLSCDHQLRAWGHLPPPLLCTLHVLAASARELQQLQQVLQQGVLGTQQRKCSSSNRHGKGARGSAGRGGTKASVRDTNAKALDAAGIRAAVDGVCGVETRRLALRMLRSKVQGMLSQLQHSAQGGLHWSAIKPLVPPNDVAGTLALADEQPSTSVTIATAEQLADDAAAAGTEHRSAPANVHSRVGDGSFSYFADLYLMGQRAILNYVMGECDSTIKQIG